jgi:hypothetical protein
LPGDSSISLAAKNALALVEQWRASKKKVVTVQPSLFEQLEEEV